jgi:rhodanese-related sulfurtransferase
LHGLGCAALNQEESGVMGLSPNTTGDNRFVLDVRTADEIAAGRSGPAGAVNIALEDLRARVQDIPRDQPLLILCEKGPRSAEAGRWLLNQGFADIVYLAGGAAMRTAR